MNAPQSRDISRPRPGYFRIRQVRGGPWVPARIRRICQCTVNGGAAEEDHAWRDTCDRFPPLVADINGAAADVMHIWTFGHFLEGQDDLTPAQEYAFQRATLAHNRTDTKAPIDLNRARPVF